MDKPLERQLTVWLKQQKKACGFYLNLTVLFGLLTGAALVVQAYLISTILHGIIIDGLPSTAFSSYFIYLIILIPLRALLAFARERSSFEAGKRLRLHIRQAVLDKISDLGPAFVKGKPAGSWATIVLEQVEDLHDFYARYLPQMLLAGFIPLMILIVVFPLNWAAGLILLTTAPLIPIFMVFVGVGAADANRKNFKALTQLSGHFMDRLKGLSTLKLFNRGEAETQAIESASESFRVKTMSVLRIAFLSSAVLEFFGAVSIAVMAIYFGFSFLGELNFGGYGASISLFIGMFVLMLSPEFYQPLRDMGTHYHAKAQAIGAAEELMTLLNYQVDAPHNAQSDHQPKENANADQRVNVEQGIALCAKDFIVTSHSGVTLLGPLSFTLQQGEKVAIVGPSGAGKTSLLNGLLGFLPYQGSLTINGVELRDLSLANWRTQLAWLGQEPQLFHGSIRDNMTLAAPNLSDTDIMALLEKARIADFVKQHPQGLDLRIGEQMAGLSVGQAQRIALARALAQQAPLFLLDEPTASLDRHSEQAVLHSLQEAMTTASCIMITHRINQLTMMDKVIVMDHGKIVQQGQVEQLQQQAGLFQTMLNTEFNDNNNDKEVSL